MNWLKDILGDAFNDEIAGKITTAIEKDYAPRGELDAAVAGKEAVEAQLTEATATIEGLKGLDPEEVKRVTAEWQEKYDKLKQDSDAKIADLSFSGVLSEAVRTAKGLSAVSIRAELGDEKIAELKASKNQANDLKAALEGLKADKAFLFEAAPSAPPYAAGTGSEQMNKPAEAGTFASAVSEALFSDK